MLVAILAGCAPRFGARPALSFAELPYPWPVKTVELDAGMRVAYVELNPEGAKTVLLVHGLGSYLKFWRHQLDELAGRGYRVVAIDLPGYGKSEKPAGFAYTMEAFAEVVHDFSGKLGLVKPVLVGHSMGGHIGLTFALLYPDELTGLVLTSPAGFERFTARERSWFAQAVRSELFIAASEEDIWASVRGNNFAGWRDDLLWLIEERVRLAKSPEFPAYAYANVLSVRGLSHTDFVRDNLGRIAVPTLIVFGGDDALIPNPFMHGGNTRDVMGFGHRGIRGSQLVELPRCGHAVQLDCPVPYNAALFAFLGRVLP